MFSFLEEASQQCELALPGMPTSLSDLAKGLLKPALHKESEDAGE